MITSFFTKYKIDIFYIILIVLISSSIRILQIDKIPSNITGDEITNITDIYIYIYIRSFLTKINSYLILWGMDL